MLCSACRKPIRPVVAIDIDGTLGDYHEHLINFSRAYLGRDENPQVNAYDGMEDHSYWFCRAFQVELHEFRAIKLAYRQGGMKRSMPLIDKRTPIWIQALRVRAEVWIATSRPWQRLDNIDPDTRHWLDRHEIEFDGLLYGDDKYNQLAEVVEPGRVAAVLDDIPEQYWMAAQLFGIDVPLLYKAWWNRCVTAPHEVERNWYPTVAGMVTALEGSLA